MKAYSSIPSSTTWKKDMGVTGLFSKTEFPALERISDLLDWYHKADDRLKGLKYEVIAQVYRHTEYIMKNKNNKDKLGASLWESRVETVKALYIYLDVCFMKNDFADQFGKDVTEHGQAEDAGPAAAGTMQWYEDKGSRTQFKISFRKGIGHRWTFDHTGKKQGLDVYDTDRFQDNLENEMSLYVMDDGGRLYCSGKEGEQALKHSSFLAGDKVLCAGTMRFEDGKLVWISGKSGHYQPKVQQILNALERLRAYQVDLTKTTVYRENYTGGFKDKVPRNFEPCPATQLLDKRSWPGVEPYAMRVG